MQAGALFSGQEYQLELLGNFSLTPVAGPFSAGAVLTAGNDTTVLVTLDGTVASQPQTGMLMVTQVEPRLVTTMPHMLRSAAWQPTRERSKICTAADLRASALESYHACLGICCCMAASNFMLLVQENMRQRLHEGTDLVRRRQHVMMSSDDCAAGWYLCGPIRSRPVHQHYHRGWSHPNTSWGSLVG